MLREDTGEEQGVAVQEKLEVEKGLAKAVIESVKFQIKWE